MAHSTAHAANRITTAAPRAANKPGPGSANASHSLTSRSRRNSRWPAPPGRGTGAEVTARPGPTGLVCLARVDQGACSASAANTFWKPDNGQGVGRAARPEHEEGGTRRPS